MWRNCRMKNIFVERVERSEHGMETHLSMSQKYGLVTGELLGEKRMLSESYAGGKLCYKDDIVLNRLKAHLGVFALAPQSGVISPDYTVLKPFTENILPRFAEYYLKSDVCRNELRIRVRGIVEGFWRLYTDDFYTIRIQLPSLDEQAQIVRYLDWKVSQINKLINAKRRQIELLGEQKRVLIHDVVKQTDTCQRCKLKNLAFFKSGTNLTSLEISDEGDYPVYGGNGLRGFYPEFSHDGEYLLVGRQGALCGNVHYVNEKFWATEHAVTVKAKDIAKVRWLYYMITNMNLNQYSNAAAQPGLSVEYVVNLPAYLPSQEKQTEIAKWLDKISDQIDTIIAKLNDELALLYEYRTRLISDVVTGKLDVRGVKVPEHEAVEEIDDEMISDNDADEAEVFE